MGDFSELDLQMYDIEEQRDDVHIDVQVISNCKHMTEQEGIFYHLFYGVFKRNDYDSMPRFAFRVHTVYSPLLGADPYDASFYSSELTIVEHRFSKWIIIPIEY